MPVFARIIAALAAAAALAALSVSCSGAGTGSTHTGWPYNTSTATQTATNTGTGTGTCWPPGYTGTLTSLNTGTATASHDSTTLPCCLGPYSSGKVEGNGVLGPFFKFDGDIVQFKHVTPGEIDAYGYARFDASWVSTSQRGASATLHWYVTQVAKDPAATQWLTTLYVSDVDPYDPHQNDMVNGGTSTIAGTKNNDLNSPGWKSAPIGEYGIAAINNLISQGKGFVNILWYYT